MSNDASFDRITELVRQLLGADVALVSLIDVDRQVFISHRGLAEPWATRAQTPLTHSFCQHVVQNEDLLQIDDARLVPFLKGNCAIDELGVIAYLGAPLTLPNGVTLGALCAIMGAPRQWTRSDAATLRSLAALVVSEIELRRQLRIAATSDRELQRRNAQFEQALSNITQGICFFDGDGRLVATNARYGEIYRLAPEDIRPGMTIQEMLELRRARGTAPEQIQRNYLAWVRSDARAQPIQSDVRIENGSTIRIIIRTLEDGGWVATHDDITEQVSLRRDRDRREEVYRLLTENSNDLVILGTAKGRRSYFSPAVTRLLGYTPEEALLVPMRDWVHPEEIADVFAASASLGPANPSATVIYRLRHKQGHYLWAEAVFRHFIDGAGTAQVVCTVRDVSKRMAVEAEYRNLFNNANVGLFRMSLDGRLLKANPALARLRGFASVQQLMACVGAGQPSWHVRPERQQAFLRAVIEQGSTSDFICKVSRHGDGAEIWISKSAWLAPATQDEPAYIEGTVLDVTERLDAQEKIERVALSDTLTGLPNRAHLRRFIDDLRQAGGDGQEGDDGQEGQLQARHLFCLDLDRFKLINDRHGHAAGDDCLRMVSHRFAGIVAAGGHFLARLGGDEFALVTAPGLSEGQAEHLAIQLIGAASRKMALAADLDAEIGVSIGIARFAHAEEDGFARGLRQADLAMYAAKKAGRNAYSWYRDDMERQVQSSFMLEADLKQAIARGELSLHLQPQVRLQDGAVTGHEALLRWNHARLGPIPPDRFIPVAEETGLIRSIGRFVLEQACRLLARLPAHLALSVNVSVVQLEAQHFVQDVLSLLAREGVAPGRLEIELTESVMVTSPAEVIERLTLLRRHGVKVAIDDFGTGYSSLSYLARFPFDRIKIDRSFVTDLVSQNSERILKSIIALGESIEKDVVVEGIETQEQCDTLARMGCRFAQGYHFGRPVPAEDVIRALEAAAGARRARPRRSAA